MYERQNHVDIFTINDRNINNIYYKYILYGYKTSSHNLKKIHLITSFV